MKVLHVLNDSIPVIGGYTSRAKYIVSHQKAIGMEPFVITSVRQGPTIMNIEKIDGIEYFRTNFSKNNISLGRIPNTAISLEMCIFFKRIRDAIRSVSPDVIHAHSPILCAIPAMFAAKMHRLPFVYEIRAFWEDAAVAAGKFPENSLKYNTIRKLETLVCNRSDRVITISQAMKNDLEKRKIPEVFVVPNGVDTAFNAKQNRDNDLITDLNLAGKVVFGYIGQFYDFEGIDDLIRAFVKLHHKQKKIALLVVGGGEKEFQVKEQARSLNAKDIIFTGRVPHEKIFNYYALMDILVYPRKKSRLTELTTPLKPLEAMALGKPVICSSVGGLMELVGPGNGLFFPPGNQDALVDCCLRLLRNPVLREGIGQNGKKRALVERDWNKIVREYIKIYDF